MANRNTAALGAVSRRQALTGLGGLALAGSCWALAGCGASTEQGGTASTADDAAATSFEPTVADTFTVAISVEPDGLDPQRTAAAATFEITNNICDPLVRPSATCALEPCLAESWEVSDDGLSVTFKLREGVTFSNGNPCDADAVVASFARLQEEESPRRSEYAGLVFEAPDSTTVVVSTEELNTALVATFASAWAAVVDVTATDTIATAPVGTGPFVVASWDPQKSIMLEANPLYWGEAPASQNVELRLLPDATSQVSSLRAGDVDVFWAEQPSQLDAFVGNDDFSILECQLNGVQLMAMNCANEALADQRVRQAVNLAVNKDELIETVWAGYGTKIGSHYPPVAQGFVDLSDTYGYDPDAARDLLDEAGYGDGLTLRMRLPESYPNYVSAGQVIADYLGKVGVTCDIEIVDWTTWLSEVYNDRDYDLTVVGHTGRVDPIVLLARYGSQSSENYFNYANDEVDELIAAYRSDLDEEARTGYVEQIQRVLAEEVPALYIQTPVMTYVERAGVHGFNLHPLDLFELQEAWVEA